MAKQKHESLAAALAAFQAALPKVGKGNTAKVTSEKGNYSYKYADLSDVSAVVLPALAEHGMSFSSKPTLTEDGRFVLAYVLRHECGQDDAGIYPLPANGTPQAIGSAISYARRYVLSAISGVAPDEDDDGQAATQNHAYDRPRAAPAQQRTAPQQRPADAPPAASAAVESPSNPEADAARADLRDKAGKAGVDLQTLADSFEKQYGESLKTCQDANRIAGFTKLQNLSSASRVAANGAR